MKIVCDFCARSGTLSKELRTIPATNITCVYYDTYSCINCSNAKSRFCRICGISPRKSTYDWMLSHCASHWNMGFEIGSFVIGLRIFPYYDPHMWFIMDKSKMYYLMLLKGNANNLIKGVSDYLVMLGDSVECDGMSIKGETEARVFSIVKNELLTCIFCGLDYDAPPTELLVLSHATKCK